jgi:ubiquinone biosynthesis protein
MASLIRVWRPVVNRAARAALVGRNRSLTHPAAGRLTRKDVRGILRSAWEEFGRRAAELPAEPTLGSRQNVALAALTLSFCEALTAAGLERRYAIELTSDICWRIYRHWGRASAIGTAPLTRDRAKLMRLRVDSFMRFPFGRPGYRFETVPEPSGRGLDVLRCPVADYLTSQGASDLCVGSWCNLDFALAEMWGGRLERSQTLAGGAPRCDFRFRTD